jgi:streptogramin lyase
VSGTAWVASFGPGEVSLLDGSTGVVVDQLSGSRLVGVRPGDHVVVAQAGAGAFVADSGSGVLDRVDGATHEVVSVGGVVAADGAAVELFPAARRLFVVDPRLGRVTVVDPVTLRVLSPVLSVRAVPSAMVVDPGGRLWFVDAVTRGLDEVDGGRVRRTSVSVDGSDRVGLVLVGGRPAVVDFTGTDFTGVHPVVEVIDPGSATVGRSACVGVSPGDPLAVAGGSGSLRVWVVSGSVGRLFESDLVSNSCGGGVMVSPGGRRFEAPVEVGGRVFLADETTGQVEVLDAATLRPVAPVGRVLAPGSEFEVFAKDGIVFFDDPATQNAGIIRPDGTVVRAVTYLTAGAPGPGGYANANRSLASLAFASAEAGPGGLGGQYPSAGSVAGSSSPLTSLASPLTGSGSSPGALAGGSSAADGPVGGLAITTTFLAPATVGQRYTAGLAAAGGSAPYKWAASGLPGGLDLDADSGVISGVPSAPEHAVVKVAVSDATDTVTSVSLALVVFSAPSTPPVISRVDPGMGPAAGGNTVTVTGSHLAAASAVQFGGLAASALTVASDTSLSVIAPPGTPGEVVNLTVTSPAGTSVIGSVDRYAYVAPQTGSGMSSPYGISASSDGALWFTNYGDNSIGRITTAGVVTNYTSPTIDRPWGITGGPDGALWFTNYGNGSIGRITTAGVITNYTGPGISNPEAIRTGPDGALWFTNFGDSSIGRITTAGVVSDYTGKGIDRPWGISAVPNGALWFTNSGNNSIGRITTAGVVTNYAGSDIDDPHRITDGADGTLWFTNFGNSSIGRITLAGVVTNYAGFGISGPEAITEGPDGEFWFTNSGNNSIGRITAAGVVTNYAGFGISSPEAIRTGPDGALWFTNPGNNSIGRITAAGFVTSYTGRQ